MRSRRWRRGDRVNLTPSPRPRTLRHAPTWSETPQTRKRNHPRRRETMTRKGRGARASIFSSFVAWSQISSTSVLNSCKFSDSNPPSCRSSSSCGGTNSFPVAFLNNSQCRGRIDGDRSAAIKGIVLIKFLMFLLTSTYNPVFFTVFFFVTNIIEKT